MRLNHLKTTGVRAVPRPIGADRAGGFAQAGRFATIHASNGSILVGVLWCLALLSVVVIGTLHSSRLDLFVVKNHGDRIQAHYLALAGIEKTKALLYRQAQNLRDNRQNYSRELFNAPNQFRDVPFGRGRFSVFRQAGENERGPVVYGVSDEESRLNLNRASTEELAKLPGLDSQSAAAIADFRDSDNNLTPGGAEAETYTALQPPYLPRNAPLLTPRELLMVRGITGSLFFGEDANQNGLLDPNEDDGDRLHPADNGNGVLDAGLSSLVTVNSSVRNVNAAGEARVNIQSADENALAAVEGISSDLAQAIVRYRNENELQSLTDLLEVREIDEGNRNSSSRSDPATDNNNNGDNNNNSSGGRNNSDGNERGSAEPATPQRSSPASGNGERLINESLLMRIADDLTSESASELPGRVNLNTAGSTVLACLPGLDPHLAEAVVSYRESSGSFENIAQLLNVPGLQRQQFEQVSSRITVRSETYRILSEGTVTSTGTRQRLQVIVRIGPYSVTTLAYREDL